MRGFYALLEGKWLYEIAGRTKDTSVGPVAIAPSMLELWTKIYSPKVLDECESFFARAEAKLAPLSDEARRLAWIKAEFCDPLVRRGRRQVASFSVGDELVRRSKGVYGRNLLAEDGEKGWYAWPSTNKSVSADVSAPTPPTCLRAVSSERTYVSHSLKGLIEPGKTYRVSMFLKGREVEPFSLWDGGVSIEISDGRKKWRYPYPNGNNGVGFSGTFDWAHAEFDFKAGPELGENQYLSVRLANCTGEGWFDAPHLAVVDVKPEGPGPRAEHR